MCENTLCWASLVAERCLSLGVIDIWQVTAAVCQWDGACHRAFHASMRTHTGPNSIEQAFAGPGLLPVMGGGDRRIPRSSLAS